MPELPTSSSTDLKTLLKIQGDVPIIPLLKRTYKKHGRILINHTKVWLEFALSVSNQVDKDPQYYACKDFCFLLERVFDRDVIDMDYVFELRQLVKKSGRILEFATLLDGIAEYNNSDYWSTNNTMYFLFFHALQSSYSKFSHSDFKRLCVLLNHRVHLLNLTQSKQLASLAFLNDRMRCLNYLTDCYDVVSNDLSMIEPYYPVSVRPLPQAPNTIYSIWLSSGDEWETDDDAMDCEASASK